MTVCKPLESIFPHPGMNYRLRVDDIDGKRKRSKEENGFPDSVSGIQFRLILLLKRQFELRLLVHLAVEVLAVFRDGEGIFVAAVAANDEVILEGILHLL